MACLIIVSLQVLSFENLTPDFELVVKTLTWTIDWTLDRTWSLIIGHGTLDIISESYLSHISQYSALKSLSVVGWWGGGLFDYSVTPGPFF